MEFLLYFLLYWSMQNKGANNKLNGKKRILATKKVAVTSHPQPTAPPTIVEDKNNNQRYRIYKRIMQNFSFHLVNSVLTK
jgi:hypothetical protein